MDHVDNQHLAAEVRCSVQTSKYETENGRACASFELGRDGDSTAAPRGALVPLLNPPRDALRAPHPSPRLGAVARAAAGPP